MTDVEKSEILVMYAKFMHFFATIYALSRGEKLSPKVHLWRKNEKYQVCVGAILTVSLTEKKSFLRLP